MSATQKGLLYVTRKVHFNAAHKLFNPKWSQEENEAVFGKCANEHWHGHNFDLYVTVKGRPAEDTGFVMDLKRLKQILEEHVVEVLDHRNINLDVPFMQGKMASIENLAIGIWEQIEPWLDTCTLHSIRLWETRNNFVTYYGPDHH